MARSLHALAQVDSISIPDEPYAVSASETQSSFAVSGLRSPSQTSNNIRRAFSVRVTESTDNSNIGSPLPPSQNIDLPAMCPPRFKLGLPSEEAEVLSGLLKSTTVLLYVPCLATLHNTYSKFSFCLGCSCFWIMPLAWRQEGAVDEIFG